MEASATVESAAAVESATAARREAATAAISAACITASNCTASVETSATAVITPAVEATATVEPATIESATVEATPTEPRAGANEDPANEPIRSVVAVWRAGVRGISVVAIRANRSTVSVVVSAVSRSAKTDANRHSLRVRIPRAKQAHRNQQTSNSSNPEVSHLRTPFRVRNFLIRRPEP